jgi:hypothetical protein
LYLTVDKIKSTICEKQIPNFYSDPWPKENRELCVYPGPKLDLSRFQIADYFQERLHLIRAAPGKLSYCGKLLQNNISMHSVSLFHCDVYALSGKLKCNSRTITQV